MVKKILKLVFVMCCMTALWVLILGLFVLTPPTTFETPFQIILAFISFAILTWYTYMMIHPYALELYSKYVETKIKE